MLFFIVVEALHALLGGGFTCFVGKANHQRLISWYSADNSSLEVSHWQFAYDTITFCDASLYEIENLKSILCWFELISGLKINFDKSEMIGIRVENNFLHLLANAIGCKIGHFPSKHLGLPLCMGIPKRNLWNPVIERIEKRLSTWKGKLISFGGRITLLKSVRVSIPIYFLSCFRCLIKVVRRIENSIWFSLEWFHWKMKMSSQVGAGVQTSCSRRLGYSFY